MSRQISSFVGEPSPLSRAVHVVQRSGLAMAGAICGTFVAALLAKTSTMFDSVGFIALMVLIGTVGFYLGTDIPRPAAGVIADMERVNLVELLSATGTFLAAIAALVSVYAIVFDEVPRLVWEFVDGSWWVLGVTMQAVAGVVGRLRLAS